MNYSEAFVFAYSNWQDLAVLLNCTPEQAYIAYLEIAALDEHHFSDEVRQSATLIKVFCDRFLSLSQQQKEAITHTLQRTEDNN